MPLQNAGRVTVEGKPRYVSRDYWSNVIRVSGGVVAGQAIGIVGYLFLTWVYGPSAFGTYASWLAVVAIGSVVCTGALETSLVRDADGSERRDATVKVVGTALVGSTIYGICCGVLFAFVPSFLEGDRFLLGASIPVAVFAMAVGTVLQSWAAAEGLFNPLTAMRIVQSSLIVLLPLTLSLSGQSAGQLILGHMLGLVAASTVWFAVFRTGGVDWQQLWQWKDFLRQRRRCFIYVLPGLLMGVLVANLPQLVVNWRFGSLAAGYLALAQRVLGVPLSLVGVAVRDVFKRYAGVAYRDRGECAKEFWSTFLSLTIVSLCFATVMLAFGEHLFVLVFGEDWREAGRMARWLLPMFVVGLVASPLTYLVYIVEREDFDLYWQSALLVIVTVILASVHELERTLTLFAAGYTAMYAIYMFYCARFARGLAGPSGRSSTGQ